MELLILCGAGKCPKIPHEECEEGFGGSAELQLQDATGFLLTNSSDGNGHDVSDKINKKKMIVSTAKSILILIMMMCLSSVEA